MNAENMMPRMNSISCGLVLSLGLPTYNLASGKKTYGAAHSNC